MDIQMIYDAVKPLWVVWLMIFFGGIVFWAFRPKNQERFEKSAMIPLSDDEQGG